jgi:hypothetical protein
MRLNNSLVVRFGRQGMLALSVFAGAWLIPAAAAASQNPELASFAVESRAPSFLAAHEYSASSEWVLHSDRAGGPGIVDGMGSRGEHLDAGASTVERFADHEIEHRSRDGGGWVEHGGFDDGHHECDDGCVSTSAVPEPARTALTLAGIAAVLFLVRRQRGRGLGMFAPS